MKGATYGSLFTGIGGLDIALESCGITPLWQVEVDPFCNSVLERHWPDVRRYGDIREIDWTGVERPDILFGGFPCQPFSVAGQNRGADDERNMWPETYRAICELRPRYIFLENVPGLLAHGYFGRILGDLAEDGYDAVWDTFTAAEVGAPHRRERLFILAYAGQQHEQLQQRAAGTEPTREVHGLADPAIDIRRASRDDGREPPHGAGDWDVADTEGQRERTTDDAQRTEPRTDPRQDASGRSGFSFPPGPDDRDAWARVLAEMPEAEPAVCRVATGVPDRTHRLKALGNAVVPAQGAGAFRQLWQRMTP